MHKGNAIEDNLYAAIDTTTLFYSKCLVSMLALGQRK